MKTQLPLFVSCKYEPFLQHMIAVFGMTKEQAEHYIQTEHQNLLDPNYKGHDKRGNPCKSLKRKRA